MPRRAAEEGPKRDDEAKRRAAAAGPTPRRRRPTPEALAREKAMTAARAAADHRAEDVVILDVRGLTLISDYFVICHGRSDLHCRAIADAVEEELEQAGSKPRPKEGYQDATWILLDCGDVITHVFSEDAREFYDLERLWGDAKRVRVSLP